MSSLFAKAIAECNVPLEWIKNNNMLTMVRMVKESGEKLMQDTPITSSNLLEKPKDDIKMGGIETLQKAKENKKVISSMEMEKNEVARIFKKNTLFTSTM